MPTLNARLDASVDDTTLSGQVSVQVDALATVQAVLSALDDAPPSEVTDLLAIADSLRLPDLGGITGLGDLLDELGGVIPSDLDDLMGPLVTVVESLLGDVGTEIVATIRAALDAVLAVQALLDVDLTCVDSGTGGSAGTGASGGGDGGGGDGGGGDGGGATGSEGTPADRAAAVAGLADLVLDALPTPLTVPGLLQWIADRVDFDDFALPLGVSLLDDLREPVQRLLAWDAMPGTAIRDELATTLEAVATLLDTAVGGAAATVEDLASPLPALLDDADLATVTDTLVTRLEAMATAVAGADGPALDAAVPALGTALDDLDGVVTTLGPLLEVAPDLATATAVLPDELDLRLGRVDAALVGSTGIRGILGTVADAADQQATAEALDAVLDRVRAAGDWLEDLLAALDLSAVTEPVATATTTVTDALADLDAALLGVAVTVRSRIEEATALLDQVDVADLRQAFVDAVDGVATDLAAELDDVAAPARAAIAAVVDALGTAVDAFDPAAVLAALTDVIDAVTGVLADPEVAGTIASVRGAIDAAVDELAAQPITPVTDAVVAAIDEVADLLRGLETDLLPAPAKLALQAALAALPSSLDPVTEPLVAELDHLIASGPIPFLETVREGPAAVAERLHAFDPAGLVGPALAGPWQELVDRANAVGPGSLLGPVSAALDDLRARLAGELDPAAALASLVAPHARLLAAVDAVDPGVLVAPIASALAEAADAIRDALGGDGLLAPVEAVTAAVLDAVETVRQVHVTLGRVRELLAELGSLDQQLLDWVDAIFTKLAAAGDDGSLATATAAVTASVDATRAAPLVARVEAAVGPVRSRLVDLAAGDRLADVTRARRAITSTAVDALPAGATRDAVQAVLARCDPLAVAFARPFRDLADLGDALATDLAGRLAGWDARHHGPDGLLDDYRDLPPDPAVLGQRARDALDERFVDPVRSVLRLAAPASGLLAGIAEELGEVLAAADARLAELAAGPTAFTDIRDQVVGLADRVSGADLAVLTDALDEVVATVRAGIEALSPTALAADLGDILDGVLDVVDLDVVLPPGELADLEATYQTVVDALRALDPGVLVTDVVGPAFDGAVTPLVDALDITPTIDALVGRLAELPGELRAELDRVDTAYQELLRAAPSIDLTDLSLDIDVAIDVPSPF